ncbi:MAG TPA: TIM-barrel domain-containing protein [Solirubrobacteraceae bacterium]|nr:TIM-barrel domain-containing protein [Solirubrobacteraceae bacterium]
MSVGSPTISTGSEDAVLERGGLRLEISLRPFSFTLRRDGRRLLRAGDLWVADGQVNDRFIKFTEGVLAHEELDPAERAQRARVVEPIEDGLELAVALQGGRQARLRVALPDHRRVAFELEADGEPLRLALEWDRRSEERFVGLGARHGTQFDQAGRIVQLGADRRYTGPDCPPDLLAEGGIPQGDCAPTPWMLSSRGYGAWLQTEANGARFDLGQRVSISSRASAGPLRALFLCDRSPAARLRAWCRLTGFPALLPEWGYGFWKSRDVYEHQDDVFDDFDGFRNHRIALDAVVIDSPWETQYNTWKFNPHQFPDARGMIARMRGHGVRTVVWVTPWVNLDSRDGQIPPQAGSERLHREPAPNYAPGAAAGYFVREPTQESQNGAGHRRRAGTDHDATIGGGEPFVTEWWMGTGSPVDFTSREAEAWWRAQAKQVLELGVEGIKADDGEGYYIPDHVELADGRTGAQAAWALGGLHRLSMQRALDEVHPGSGVLFGRSGWTGQHASGHTWAGDQASDFWSLRALVAATLSAACSGYSNWSHDVGGYLGHRLVERCPPELLVRWLQFGCFTPLMQAHGRMPQEPWHYSERVLGLYRAYVLLHEQLVPYVRAAAATAARTGLPIVRPLCLLDPTDDRGWEIPDAYGYGPALWVAPVLHDGAREREVPLPRGEWIEAWSGDTVRGGSEVVVETPLHLIPVWVRSGSIVVSYPAAHVASGLGDVPEAERPLVATLWGRPRLGSAGARLADGTRIGWRHGEWSASPERDISFREVGVG